METYMSIVLQEITSPLYFAICTFLHVLTKNGKPTTLYERILTEIKWEGVVLMHLTQDRKKWSTPVSTVLEYQVL